MKNWVPRWDSKLVAVNNRAQQLPYHNTLNLPVSLWTPLTIHACKALMAPPPSKTCPPQSSSSSRTSRRVVYSTIIQIITSTSDKFARWVETHSRWDSHDIPPRKFTSRLQLMKGPKAFEIFQQSLMRGERKSKTVLTKLQCCSDNRISRNHDCVCFGRRLHNSMMDFSKNGGPRFSVNEKFMCGRSRARRTPNSQYIKNLIISCLSGSRI